MNLPGTLFPALAQNFPKGVVSIKTRTSKPPSVRLIQRKGFVLVESQIDAFVTVNAFLIYYSSHPFICFTFHFPNTSAHNWVKASVKNQWVREYVTLIVSRLLTNKRAAQIFTYFIFGTIFVDFSKFGSLILKSSYFFILQQGNHSKRFLSAKMDAELIFQNASFGNYAFRGNSFIHAVNITFV